MLGGRGIMRRKKILYYITPEAKASPIYNEMATKLAQGMQEHADIDFSVTRDDYSRVSLNDYDLVHLFGCWNNDLTHLLTDLYACHVPTVFSPLGGLQPWLVRQHKGRFGFSAQRDAVRKALAVHVCGKLEYETFVSLKWNSHVALIKNPVLTSKVTFAEMSTQVMRLYQKVVDSYARLLLNETSRKAVGGLLALGVDDTILKDKKCVDALRELLGELEEDEWRKIFLYASDERISDVLELALVRLQTDKPTIDVAQIDRYSCGTHYPEGELDGQKLLSRNPLTKSKLIDVFDTKDVKEKSVVVQLLNLKYEMEHQIAPMAHLADIYQTIRFCDIDEDKLNEAARLMGIIDFSQRLMTVLHNILGLTEGFMPFNAKEDKVARQMTKAITKFNSY